MLEEFLKSISIVFYEALCCRIFLPEMKNVNFCNFPSNYVIAIDLL